MVEPIKSFLLSSNTFYILLIHNCNDDYDDDDLYGVCMYSDTMDDFESRQ